MSIYCLLISSQNQTKLPVPPPDRLLIDGLCDLKRKIIGLFGETVKNIYIQSATLGGS